MSVNDQFEKMMNGGIRKGELNVWTAGTGVGKSVFSLTCPECSMTMLHQPCEACPNRDYEFRRTKSGE